MSTPITPAVPEQTSLLDRLLKIADLAAKGIASVSAGTPLGDGASMADLLIEMGLNAKGAYEAEVGQPYDLNKIPTEDRVQEPEPAPEKPSTE